MENPNKNKNDQILQHDINDQQIFEELKLKRNGPPIWMVWVAFILMVLMVAIPNALYNDEAVDGFSVSYVQPDGVTFSVWGIIYLFHALYVIYTTFWPRAKLDPRVEISRPYIILTYLFNGGWLVTNTLANLDVTDSFWLPVWVLVAHTVTLILAWRVLYTAPPGSIRDHPDNCAFAWFVRAPISLNLAWVVLASILNFSNTLFFIQNLPNFPTIIGGPDWAIGIAGLATVIASYLAFGYKDIGYTLVTSWALFGIFRNQSDSSDFPHDQSSVQSNFALACAIILLIFVPLVFLIHWLGWIAELQRSSYVLEYVKDSKELAKRRFSQYSDQSHGNTSLPDRNVVEAKESSENEPLNKV